MIDEILSGSHVQKRYFHVKMHSGLDVFKIPASKLAYYQIANSKRGDEEYTETDQQLLLHHPELSEH